MSINRRSFLKQERKVRRVNYRLIHMHGTHGQA